MSISIQDSIRTDIVQFVRHHQPVAPDQLTRWLRKTFSKNGTHFVEQLMIREGLLEQTFNGWRLTAEGFRQAAK